MEGMHNSLTQQMTTVKSPFYQAISTGGTIKQENFGYNLSEAKLLPNIVKTIDLTKEQTDTCPVCCEVLQPATSTMWPQPNSKYSTCAQCSGQLFPFPYFVLDKENHTVPMMHGIHPKTFSQTVTYSSSKPNEIKQVFTVSPTTFPLLHYNKK